MPVYNEAKFIEKAISKVMASNTQKIKKELIVINDGSTDKTGVVLSRIKKRCRRPYFSFKVITLKVNHGKGYALKRGLKEISGQVVVIQDADLEYDPNEYLTLLSPILGGDADVVFGSRFMGDRPHRVLFFWHMVANKFLTLISNMFTNLNLTDMETGYKMFTKEVAKNLQLHENRFGVEPEFTAKVARMGARIYEVGISYKGRNYDQGKKINWKDGIWALYCIFKYNIFG